MARLFSFHSRGLAAAYADLENQAAAQARAFVSAPGSVLERTNAGGFRFYALQQYGADGRKRETYLAGPVGDPTAEDAAQRARRAIGEQRDVAATARLLIREGYGTMPPKHHAVLAALANHGFFRSGGLLVGTHAFEAILNKLGVRAEAFATMDVDIARSSTLELRDVAQGGLLEILRSSGIPFDEVPGFDPRDATGKIKERGHSRFTVDLLVPGRGRDVSHRYVPELKAHAVALPHLGYLVAETQPAAALSRNGCIGVRVPLAERYAVHKLLVSRLRSSGNEKSRKDLRQAAILIAVLAETAPGAIAEAHAALSSSARGFVKNATPVLLPLLADYPAALEEVRALR